MPECSFSYRMKGNDPVPGKILIQEILHQGVACLDRTFLSFQRLENIIGFGISSFVTNLIGIYLNRSIIPNSTISYACCSKDVLEDFFTIFLWTISVMLFLFY